MNEQEQKSIVAACIMAAFTDGSQSDVERTQIKRIMDGFPDAPFDLAAVYQDVLGKKINLAWLAGSLQSPEAKSLAYEMAVCVCHADGILSDAERNFLTGLREALALDAQSATAIQQQAEAIAVEAIEVPPVIPAPSNRDAELDRMILNYAILNGALEIMPQSLATMAIIPLQMRMVHRIGKESGFELGRGHIKDFLATVGVGLTAQVVEGFARTLVRKVARQIGGGLIGGLAGQATGSAFSFATTYALGQAAKRYYAGGRTLTAAQLQESFTALFQESKLLQNRYSQDIMRRAHSVKMTELLPLIRQN